MRAKSDSRWLADFIAANCHYVPGAMMPAGEFADTFLDYLRPREPHEWTKLRVLRGLPRHFPYGKHNGNQRFVGNIAWTYRRSTLPAITLRNGRLRRPRVSKSL